MSIRNSTLGLVWPITRTIGQIHMPFSYRKINGLHYFDLVKRLQPGDVFVTRKDGELSNLVIPGKYKHAAIYYGNNVVIEAMGRGVCQTDLISFLLSKDFVVVRRPRFCPITVQARAAEIALAQEGKPYDSRFEFTLTDNKSFYCSELVWWSYVQACQEAKIDCPFVPYKTFGEPTVTPDDIVKANAKWMTTWDSETIALDQKTLLAG